MDLRARRRFARQLLLAEIGDAGQARLCASAVRFAGGADPRAVAVAGQYLERAGMQLLPADAADRADAPELALPDASAVRALAGAPELDEAAAALAGALLAVEAIKGALDIGRKVEPLDGLRLRSEGAS